MNDEHEREAVMVTAEKRRINREDSARRLASDLVTVIEGLATSRLSGDLLKQQAVTAHYLGRRRLDAILSDDSEQADGVSRARLAAVLRAAERDIRAGWLDESALDLLGHLCDELGLSRLDVVDGGLR